MSGPLIILTGLIYLYVGCEQAFRGNVGASVMYFAYALANVGAYMLVK
jgi:hypothetical protein